MALDRQVQESVNIFEGNKKASKCLNLKNEWGGAKMPGLEVRTPKVVARAWEEEDRKAEGRKEGSKKRMKKKINKEEAS